MIGSRCLASLSLLCGVQVATAQDGGGPPPLYSFGPLRRVGDTSEWGGRTWTQIAGPGGRPRLALGTVVGPQAGSLKPNDNRCAWRSRRRNGEPFEPLKTVLVDSHSV